MRKEYNYRNKDWLKNQYRTLNKSIYQIADEENVNGQTILNWMNKFEIPVRSKAEWWELDSYRNKITYNDNKKIWSKKEIETLKKLYPRTDIGVTDIAIAMGRTPASVGWKANELGLSRPLDYRVKKATENLMYFWEEIFPNYTKEEKKKWRKNMSHPGLKGKDNPCGGKTLMTS